jgi:DNA-binding response OmpR family regulator
MCGRCMELEERVAYLEGELGLRLQADQVARLREVLLGATMGVTRGRAQPAEAVLALYRAKGRPVTKWQLMDAVPPASGVANDDERDPKIVNVWVCVARKGLGADAISTVWGRGYQMTVAGMARVTEILAAGSPPGSA